MKDVLEIFPNVPLAIFHCETPKGVAKLDEFCQAGYSPQQALKLLLLVNEDMKAVLPPELDEQMRHPEFLEYLKLRFSPDYPISCSCSGCGYNDFHTALELQDTIACPCCCLLRRIDGLVGRWKILRRKNNQNFVVRCTKCCVKIVASVERIHDYPNDLVCNCPHEHIIPSCN